MCWLPFRVKNVHVRDDRTYFLKRAEAQMALARRAVCENAARAHYHLAGFYWDRAYNQSPATPRESGSLLTPASSNLSLG